MKQPVDNETLAIRVPVHMADKAIRVLRNLRLLDDRFQLRRSNHTLIIPIVRELLENEVSQIADERDDFSVQRVVLAEVKRRPRDLKEAVEKDLPQAMVSKLPRSYDVIGDIALLELSSELSQFAHSIGQGVLKLNPNLRLVLKRTSDTSGTFRTRTFDAIAGTGSTVTVHHEFSNSLRLDVALVYFSPRLSHERKRVANQVRERECVVDMFAGVGPYSILIAKTQLSSMVYSIDINPEALRYLRENVLLNRVADRVVPILGDARTIVARYLSGVADRVIMNLPSESSQYLDVALGALRPDGGIIHYYAFASRDETIESIAVSVRKEAEGFGRKVQSISSARVLKEISPKKVQVGLDLVVR